MSVQYRPVGPAVPTAPTTEGARVAPRETRSAVAQKGLTAAGSRVTLRVTIRTFVCAWLSKSAADTLVSLQPTDSPRPSIFASLVANLIDIFRGAIGRPAPIFGGYIGPESHPHLPLRGTLDRAPLHCLTHCRFWCLEANLFGTQCRDALSSTVHAT